MKFSIIPPKRISFKLKKYLYIANDITNTLLKKEREKEDKRVRKMTIAIIIMAAILLVSLLWNIYLAK